MWRNYTWMNHFTTGKKSSLIVIWFSVSLLPIWYISILESLSKLLCFFYYKQYLFVLVSWDVGLIFLSLHFTTFLYGSWVPFSRKSIFPSIRIIILKIKLSWDCLCLCNCNPITFKIVLFLIFVSLYFQGHFVSHLYSWNLYTFKVFLSVILSRLYSLRYWQYLCRALIYWPLGNLNEVLDI